MIGTNNCYQNEIPTKRGTVLRGAGGGGEKANQCLFRGGGRGRGGERPEAEDVPWW